MTDPVCPLCVQWRCENCKSQDWPDCCDYSTEAEPFWANGTVAVLTQDEWCTRCTEAVADYQADVREGNY